MPTRWNAETALGDAYVTRASASSTITPSPTRGRVAAAVCSAANGKAPLAIMSANRRKIEEVGALELAERTPDSR